VSMILALRRSLTKNRPEEWQLADTD